MTLPLADAGGAVLPDNLGPLEIDSLDQQIRESAAELGRKNGPREDTWQPRYEPRAAPAPGRTPSPMCWRNAALSKPPNGG